MHEFVVSARRLKREPADALDVAKRLIDHGFHPPTIYFPLIVRGADDRADGDGGEEALDAFADAMPDIAREAVDDPEALKRAPTPLVGRLDEVTAAKPVIVRYGFGAARP